VLLVDGTVRLGALAGGIVTATALLVRQLLQPLALHARIR
jgi:hypothetical protein